MNWWDAEGPRLRLGAVAAVAVALIAPASLVSPAQAQGPALVQVSLRGLAVRDPVGDATDGARLDITRFRVSNRSNAVIVVVAFKRTGRGRLTIVLDTPRGRVRDAGVSSLHRPHRGDVNGFGTRAGVQVCHGLAVRWRDADNFARVRIPANCLYEGRYHKVRVQILTELTVDQDFAPQLPSDESGEFRWGWTRWIPRS